MHVLPPLLLISTSAYQCRYRKLQFAWIRQVLSSYTLQTSKHNHTFPANIQNPKILHSDLQTEGEILKGPKQTKSHIKPQKSTCRKRDFKRDTKGQRLWTTIVLSKLTSVVTFSDKSLKRDEHVVRFALKHMTFQVFCFVSQGFWCVSWGLHGL